MACEICNCLVANDSSKAISQKVCAAVKLIIALSSVELSGKYAWNEYDELALK